MSADSLEFKHVQVNVRAPVCLQYIACSKMTVSDTIHYLTWLDFHNFIYDTKWNYS